jgi:subtilisin family serine protease
MKLSKILLNILYAIVLCGSGGCTFHGGGPGTGDHKPNFVVDRFKSAKTLVYRDKTSSKSLNVVNRERLIRLSTFKYPKLLVHEQLLVSPGGITLLGQVAKVADHLLVIPLPSANSSAVKKALSAINGTVTKTYPLSGIRMVTFPNEDDDLDLLAANIAKLKSYSSLFECVEADTLCSSASVDDPWFGEQWGMHDPPQGKIGIRAPSAWNIQSSSKSIKVGIIDSGIRLNHEDFLHKDGSSNIWKNSKDGPKEDSVDDDGNGYLDDYHGWDFCGKEKGDRMPDDGNGHGTHCAGIVGAAGNNGKGVSGVCQGASLVIARILNNYNRLGTSADAAEAILYCHCMKCRIVSASWVLDHRSECVERSLKLTPEMLFVTAAGNDYRNIDNGTPQRPRYPASYPQANVIAVAALTCSGKVAGFSNHGATSVDIGAPGVGIYSTSLGSAPEPLDGTSEACPFVAGVCALVWAKWPEMSAADVKAKVLGSFTPVPDLQGKLAKPGYVNALKALQ